MEEGATDARELLRTELADLSLVLLDEPKNYHAWQYRQWLLTLLGMHLELEDEIKSLNEIIMRDPFNNSAWNHRFFLFRTFGFPLECDVKFVQQALDKISSMDTINQAIINYIHGAGLFPHVTLNEAHQLRYRQLFDDQ